MPRILMDELVGSSLSFPFVSSLVYRVPEYKVLHLGVVRISRAPGCPDLSLLPTRPTGDPDTRLTAAQTRNNEKQRDMLRGARPVKLTAS